MAPTSTEHDTSLPVRATNKLTSDGRTFPKPLKLEGALDRFHYDDVTPVIGREFPDVDIVTDLMNADNADDLLREVAVTISQRGVVFFRAQDNLTDELQKDFVQKLGLLSGKPSTSTLHVHPLLNHTNEFGVGDAQISTISSLARKKMFDHERQRNKRKYDNAKWHSDIQFEKAPADYTSLRLTQLPRTGGDTCWASGYELYDRCSKTYQKFLESLTATFVGEGFLSAAERDPENNVIYEGERGSPLNVGPELTTVHPVVRTNPVTGWKSVYAAGSFPTKINELNAEESDELLASFYKRIVENTDLQVRFKWRNKNDIAIWDNRSVFHAAIFDYEGMGDRHGSRVVGIGEPPYLDPDSKSRTEDLGIDYYD